MKTPLVYNPSAGTPIQSAIEEALSLSRRFNRRVRFCFNGQRMIATKRLSARHLETQWRHSMTASTAAYRRSTEFAKWQRIDAAAIANAQASVDALVAMLPTVTTLDGVMAWLRGFTDPSDRCGVEFDHLAIAAELERMGFIGNEYVGRGSELGDVDKLGRYIAGQAITCLRAGHGPHPVTHRFVRDYLGLKKLVSTVL